jgi:hypothetical protein
VEGACPVDAGPRHDGGISSLRKDAREPPDGVGVGGRAVDYVVVLERPGFRVPVVHRNRDEDRAPWMLHRGVVGPPDLPRYVRGPHGLETPLDVWLREFDEPPGQQRLQGYVTPVLLPGGNHERGLVVPRRDHGPHRVAEAWARVQVDKGSPPLAPGETLRHP